MRDLKSQSVAIGVIMKQEAPYILEWVYYHKTLGFELIIADHGGTDGTSEILTALHNAKVITRLDFRFKKTSPQIPAYRAILRLARIMGINIIGFLDADEFFSRDIPIRSLSPEAGAGQITSEFRRLKATQISYNWLAYGSKTTITDLSLPVLTRFSYHAKLDSQEGDRSFKSFVVVREMFTFLNLFLFGPPLFSPHYCQSKEDGWYLDNKLIQKRDFQKQWNSYQNGAILHFQVKTWEEFQRKVHRGAANHPKSNFNLTKFRANDLNEICSEIESSIIEQIIGGINNLKDMIDGYSNIDTRTGYIHTFWIKILSMGLSDFRNHKFTHFIYKQYRKLKQERNQG